jgi:outer membrane immunogenic protein
MRPISFFVALVGAGAAVSAASAADLPAKAPMAPVPVVAPYNWTGLYLAGGVGYQWAKVHDLAPASGFVTDSTVRNGLVSGIIGGQYQFNVLPLGGLVVGAEAAGNAVIRDNSTDNFGLCANPAFKCGLRRLQSLRTVGGRLGWAYDRWLVTVSGGWASAEFDRADFNSAGIFNAGGGGSNFRHHGHYFGGGLEYMIYSNAVTDIMVGIDYQHVWLNSQTDINANGVEHTMDAKDDIVRGRLTVKLNPWR